MKRKRVPIRSGPSVANRLTKAVLATGITFLLGDVAATAQSPIYQNTNTTSQAGVTFNNTVALSPGSAAIQGIGAWDSLYAVNTAQTTNAKLPYWKITSTSVGVYNSGSTARTETIKLSLWGGVNTSTLSGQIVTNTLGTWSKTQTLAPGYNTIQVATPNAWYTPSALGAGGTPVGVQVITMTSGEYDGGAGPEFVKAAPTVGTQNTNAYIGEPNVVYFAHLVTNSTTVTPNAFKNAGSSYYLETVSGFPVYALDGAFASSKFGEYAYLQLNGIAVPGPSAVVVFAGLGMPAFGLLRRRRQRFAAKQQANVDVESVEEVGHVPRRRFVARGPNQRRC